MSAATTGALGALAIAVEVAERQRDGLRRQLQDALSGAQAAGAQLEQLQGYAGETQNRWGVQANAQRKPEVLFHHMHFMDRLHHAMGLQDSVVADHGRRVGMAQQALLAAELRLASLTKLIGQRRSELAQQQARREQKQTDERAALQYRAVQNAPLGQEP